MSTPKFESTVTLGALLQIMALVVTMFGGVWYVSGQQAQIVQENRSQAEHMAQTDEQLKEVRAEFQRRDVATAESTSLKEKLDMIMGELQEIRAQVGLSPKKEWRTWK